MFHGDLLASAPKVWVIFKCGENDQGYTAAGWQVWASWDSVCCIVTTWSTLFMASRTSLSCSAVLLSHKYLGLWVGIQETRFFIFAKLAHVHRDRIRSGMHILPWLHCQHGSVWWHRRLKSLQVFWYCTQSSFRCVCSIGKPAFGGHCFTLWDGYVRIPERTMKLILHYW